MFKLRQTESERKLQERIINVFICIKKMLNLAQTQFERKLQNEGSFRMLFKSTSAKLILM